MNDRKHIEGPWRFVEREVLEDGSVYPQHIVGGPNELQVCLLEGPVVADLAIKDKWPSGKPRTADLILAAPELLEALQTTALLLQASCMIFDPESRGIALEAVKEARAAIAKATGA